VTGEATAGAPAARVESSLFNWGTGGAILAGCVDLLVSVLLGLMDPASGDATRFTARDLGLLVGLAGLVSFGVAALGWRGRSREVLLAGGIHALLAAGAFVAGGRVAGGVPRFFLATVAVHGLAAVAAFSAAPGASDRRAFFAGRHGAENLESILVAIVFALVIRHFAVEAYKIPTESMSPTLLGDLSKRGPGDRVLVAKWPALLGGPERYQVWVFRPPLDRTINYVKRVTGLPGEAVEVRDGDLYVDGRISRKPEKTREEMWFGVSPRLDGQPDASPPWTGEAFRKVGDSYVVKGAAARALLVYDGQVRDAAYGRGGQNEVGDVRLRFTVEDAEPGTVIVARMTGRAGPCEVRLAADGSRIEAEVAGKRADLGSPPGEPIDRVEVYVADLQLGLRLDGGDLRTADLEALPPRGRLPFGVAFGVEKGGASFGDVRLDRDVYYTGSYTFQVPAGHYLFLGDNSGNSQDSRMWRAWQIRETAPGGRTFYADNKPYGLDRDGRVTFKDRNQVLRSYLPDEVSVSDSQVPLSFVPAEDLHGRAFAIFWPPRWFTTAPGGRVRFLP
jgi:signal peptidase I